MGKYIIAYDLMYPGQKWAKIDKLIPTLGRAHKILNTTWVLLSTLDPDQISNSLGNLIDGNDKLAVLEVTGEGVVRGYSDAELAKIRTVTAAA